MDLDHALWCEAKEPSTRKVSPEKPLGLTMGSGPMVSWEKWIPQKIEHEDIIHEFNGTHQFFCQNIRSFFQISRLHQRGNIEIDYCLVLQSSIWVNYFDPARYF